MLHHNVHTIIPTTRTLIPTIRVAQLIPKTRQLLQPKARILRRVGVHDDLDGHIALVVRRRVASGDLVRDGVAVGVGGGRVLDAGHVHGGEGVGDEGFERGAGHVGGLELGFERGLEDVGGEVLAAGGAV